MGDGEGGQIGPYSQKKERSKCPALLGLGCGLIPTIILRLFDILPNFSFPTNETKRDYIISRIISTYTWNIGVAS